MLGRPHLGLESLVVMVRVFGNESGRRLRGRKVRPVRMVPTATKHGVQGNRSGDEISKESPHRDP